MTAPAPVPSQPALYRVGTLTYTRLGVVMVFFWLLWGDFFFTLMEGVNNSIIPLRLIALHSTNYHISMIMTTIPVGIALVFNPIISFRSDRFRSRWGRRIPFIIATLPLLVLSLVGLGWSEPMGAWLHAHSKFVAAHFSANEAMVMMISIFMVLFAFFNTFVNSVFWYLFNDVVPQHLLARFTAFFRVVGAAASSFYLYFIFPHSAHHTPGIFTGAALAYAIGFIVMCCFVKEPVYPPPPANVDGGQGAWSSVKTYAFECTRTIYVFLFIIAAAQAAIWSSLTFTNPFSQATGLSLQEIGDIGTAGSIAGCIFYFIAAWLADRFHPMRLTLIGLATQVLLATPAQCFWLVAQPSHNTTFWYWMLTSICLGAPALAMIGMFGVVTMRLYPKTRYGQFCSAAVIWRSILQIPSGLAVGVLLDWIAIKYGQNNCYFWLPVYQEFFYAMMLVYAIAVYLLWKRHGGDQDYRPPGFEREEEQIRAHDEEPGYIDHPVHPAAPAETTQA
jgi:maltose/moltooligosaccharide transporter